MSDDDRSAARRLSRSEVVAVAERWLAEHPDGPLRERVVMAVAAETGGDLSGTWPSRAIAERLARLGVRRGEIAQVFFSVIEVQQLRDQQQRRP